MLSLRSSGMIKSEREAAPRSFVNQAATPRPSPMLKVALVTMIGGARFAPF